MSISDTVSVLNFDLENSSFDAKKTVFEPKDKKELKRFCQLKTTSMYGLSHLRASFLTMSAIIRSVGESTSLTRTVCAEFL